MTGWRVDPDRVVGVLAGVDDEGARLVEAVAGMDELAEAGGSLSVDGRTALSHAWEAVIDERRLVPGTLMHVVAAAAHAVSAATTAVVAGDETMAVDARDAGAYALHEWGIEAPDAYAAGGW